MICIFRSYRLCLLRTDKKTEAPTKSTHIVVQDETMQAINQADYWELQHFLHTWPIFSSMQGNCPYVFLHYVTCYHIFSSFFFQILIWCERKPKGVEIWHHWLWTSFYYFGCWYTSSSWMHVSYSISNNSSNSALSWNLGFNS